MNRKKLQILVPQYQEDDSIIKPLLDSIELQQNVDLKNDVGVIIVNDGSSVFLSEDLLNKYTYTIEYYKADHGGVSKTRNTALDYATADYVMFCDADDMFCSACGLYIIFQEFKTGFDALVSAFIEETRNFQTGEPVYISHGIDVTFVHGKIYRRQFLIDSNIRFKDELTIHEDSYFNCLAQKCAKEVKYCPNQFYLWRWRDASVCRHDPKYILKTFNNMLDSSTALITEFLRRDMRKEASFYATSMIFDSYFTMNKKEWIDQENKEYRKAVEERFKIYYKQFEVLFLTIDEKDKAQIIVDIKNRFFGEGLLMESITFDDWIRGILNNK